MLTVATSSAPQCGCARNMEPSVASGSTAKLKHATFKTWMNQSRHKKRPFQQAGGAAIRRQLRTVAARTESVDIPLGDSVPDFQVSPSMTVVVARITAKGSAEPQ